jgi:DNA-binding LytR/AlgR family response regulator
MKIAVFENELDAVKGAFDVANLTKFNKSLDVNYFASSQSADFNKIASFDVIFVDIDLSTKSNLDGFGVISKIKSIDDHLANRIIILTGNDKIRETMESRNISDSRINIIFKPTNYEEVARYINSVTK